MPQITSIEQAITEGDIDRFVQLSFQTENDQMPALLLMAIAFEQPIIANHLLYQYSQHLDENTIAEAFCSAAVHNEPEVMSSILASMPNAVSPDTLIHALKMAVVNGYEEVIAVIEKEENLPSIVNDADQEHPHILTLATDLGDFTFLERLLRLPGIRVLFQHAAYADQQKKHQIAQMLKMHLAKQKDKESHKNIWQYELSQGETGPHLKVEIEKIRQYRQMQRSRFHS